MLSPMRFGGGSLTVAPFKLLGLPRKMAGSARPHTSTLVVGSEPSRLRASTMSSWWNLALHRSKQPKPGSCLIAGEAGNLFQLDPFIPALQVSAE